MWNMTARVNLLYSNEVHLGSPFGFDCCCSENEGGFLAVNSDYRLFAPVKTSDTPDITRLLGISTVQVRDWLISTTWVHRKNLSHTGAVSSTTVMLMCANLPICWNGRSKRTMQRRLGRNEVFDQTRLAVSRNILVAYQECSRFYWLSELWPDPLRCGTLDICPDSVPWCRPTHLERQQE